ncbi:MAG: hypothetical protein NDI90_07560 [Nitrospira sp. BO4]|jgi:hypothetical protein|nr:hypothetical protein [Nitrospira sp. BO4]
MVEEYGKELMMLGGTIAGFLAALLTVMEKLLDIQQRVHSKKERKSSTQTERPAADPAPSVDFFSSKPLRGSSYLLLYEIGVIVAAGVLLNYVGLTLSRHLESILFLDMTGTALVAILLGPWWGAIAALLSNSVVNWLLYPEAGADVIIFPWSLVNMTGALFWGMLARQPSFLQYVRTGKSSGLAHTWFLLSFGVAGAVVMSVPGTFVQSALHERAIFALNPEVAESLSIRVSHWEAVVQSYLESAFGVSWSESISWYVVNWFQNCVRYIPDKTMSAAIALVILKYGYPLFERELIHGGPEGERPEDERILPLVLGLIYAPSYASLISQEDYTGHLFWPLWSIPWLFILYGYFRIRYWGSPDESLRSARILRAERYARALKQVGKEPSYEFCRRLTFATLIASLIFALCLPILLMDFYRVTFKFFCVVYGFLLVVHLIRVAIAQNISVARAD